MITRLEASIFLNTPDLGKALNTLVTADAKTGEIKLETNNLEVAAKLIEHLAADNLYVEFRHKGGKS